MTRHGSHTESRMRENCTYGSMRGRAYPTGESRSTLHPFDPRVYDYGAERCGRGGQGYDYGAERRRGVQCSNVILCWG